MIVVGVVSSMLSSRPHWEGAKEQAVWGCGLLLLAMRRGGVCGSGAGAGHTAAPAGQRAQCRDGWAHVCVAAGSSRGSPRQGTASCNCSSDERRGGCLQRCRAPTEPRSCAQRRQLCRCPSAAPPTPPLQLAAGRSRPACACCCGDERAPLRPARTAAPHSRLRMIRSSSGSGGGGCLSRLHAPSIPGVADMTESAQRDWRVWWSFGARLASRAKARNRRRLVGQFPAF